MKNVAWIAVILLSTLVACNYTEGQCYYLGEDSTGIGVGGGVIVTNGAGGFGNVPPEPQGIDDLPPPDCNIVQDTPCKEKCLKDYEEAAAVCGKMEDEAQRRSCQDAAFVVYDKCRENCAVTGKADCKERCKKQCDKIHDRCHEDCNKNDPTKKCHAQCNDEYAACLNECEKDCK